VIPGDKTAPGLKKYLNLLVYKLGIHPRPLDTRKLSIMYENPKVPSPVMNQQSWDCVTSKCNQYFNPPEGWCVTCLTRGWRQGNELGQEHKTDRLQEAIALVENEESWNAFLDELLK
jgi:hypothetical protein